MICTNNRLGCVHLVILIIHVHTLCGKTFQTAAHPFIYVCVAAYMKFEGPILVRKLQ